MRLERKRMLRLSPAKRAHKRDKDYASILQLLDRVRSSFVVARYFLSLNQRPDLVTASIIEGCEMFEKAKKLLAGLNGFSKERRLLETMKVLEKEISLLKKIS